MNVYNEWDPLKKVIVGIADNAKLPTIDKSVRVVNYADTENVESETIGRYPQQVIDEANEDLEIFVSYLKSGGIEVVRPVDTDPLYYNYCPRDSVIAYGNMAYATPMPIRARKDEWAAMEKYFDRVTILQATRDDSLYNEDCIGNPDILALNETEAAFDAANVLRANEDLLYLVSNSGNKKGAKILQEILGQKANVHTIEKIYSYMHIDSTLAFLREGLILANPRRVRDKYLLPKPFRDWEVIFAPDPVDIGHYPGYCASSVWVSVNLLSINPNLVVLEEHQTNLRDMLKKYKIECEMLPMRHSRTLGGCFHCVTLDLVRE